MFLFSFFPAGLSLVIELMFTKAGRPQWDVKQIIKSLPTDEVQNPVVYRSETRDDSMTRTLDTHLVCLQGASREILMGEGNKQPPLC